MLDSYLATAAAASPLLRSAELVQAWTKPSVLADFATSGLAAHLVGCVSNVELYLDRPRLPGVEPVDAVRYYVEGNDPDAPTDDPVKQRIRARADERATVGPAGLADDFDGSLARLAGRLPGLDPAMLVTVFDRWVLRLDQFLLTRMVELAVHLDDLAVSLDLPTPAIPDEAADLVVVTLARIARGRRGTLPVLRALSRRERASGLATAF